MPPATEPVSTPPPNVRILIQKSTSRLQLLTANGVANSYDVVLGNNPVDKQLEGDCATPLGSFYVCAKNPRSKFLLSLCLSYPNVEDATRGLAAGLINLEDHRQILCAIAAGNVPPQYTALGGEIYIHGYALGDDGIAIKPLATRGCIAVNNHAMQTLFDLIDIGAQVDIIP